MEQAGGEEELPSVLVSAPLPPTSSSPPPRPSSLQVVVRKEVVVDSSPTLVTVYREVKGEVVCSPLLPTLHLLVVAFATEEELVEVLEAREGVLAYTEAYWQGFFPLLLVRVVKGEVATPSLPTMELEHFSCHHLLTLAEEQRGVFLSSCASLLLHHSGTTHPGHCGSQT